MALTRYQIFDCDLVESPIINTKSQVPPMRLWNEQDWSTGWRLAGPNLARF